MLRFDSCYLNVGSVITGPGASFCRKGFVALLTHIGVQEWYVFSKGKKYDTCEEEYYI